MAELASWDEVFDTVEKSKSGKQSSSPPPKPKAEPESWDDVDAAIKKVESGFSPEYLKELRAAEAVAQIGIESAPLGVQEWGAAAALPPEYRRAALERSAELFKERGPMKGAGNIKRTAVAIAQGGVDWGMPAANFFAPKELQLDGDQEAFRQALISVREGNDPSLSEGSIASTIQQAARMATPMIGMGVAGRASGTIARSAGLGATGTRVAQGVGVTAAAYPMAADQSYRSLIAEGLDPKIAAPVSRISGLFEGVIESIIPDPFKVESGVLKGSIRKIVTEGMRRAGVQAGRIGIEASEEGAQAFTREAMYEVARAIDKDIPNQGLGQAFVAAAEEGLQSIGPLAVIMGPSITLGALGTARNTASRPEQYREAIERRDFERLRRELANSATETSTNDSSTTATQPAEVDANTRRLTQLQEIRAKGFVSEEDAQQVGIEGKNRKERLANMDKEIQALQNLIEPQSTPTADPTSLVSPTPATQATQVPSTPPSGTATPPVASQPGGEAGAAVAGIGKGLVEGLYTSMYERLQAGQYPGIAKNPSDDAVAAEHARQPFQTPEEIRQFINDGSRPIQEPSPTEVTPEEAARLMQERIALRRAGQQQEPPAQQPTEQAKRPTGLPPLKPGYARVVHIGRPGQEESFKGGLDYSGVGMLQSTARAYSNENEAEYSSEDPRFKSGTAYVYDVPESEMRQHGIPRTAPGKIPGSYYVGSVPPSNATPAGDAESKGTAETPPTATVDRASLINRKQRLEDELGDSALYDEAEEPLYEELKKINKQLKDLDSAESKGTTETTPTATVDREWQPTELPKPKYPDEVDALPKDSLYRTTAGGEEFIAVRGVGKRGGGDQLFKTVEEANAHIERQKIIDQQNEEVRKKREEREAAEAKKESDYVASFQGFKQDNPREFGRARKVLDVQRNYRDKVQTRKQIIEQSVADGANVIDGRLERPDGTSLGEDAVTKIGIQYAEHLIAARLRSDAAKAELRGDNEMSVALNRQADLLVKPESKWQAETRAKLDAVPALKGSKFEMDEQAGTVKVTRPDDIKVTIHFKSDDKIKEWGKKKGFNPEKTYGWAVKTNAGEIGIFVRSDANHTNVLNHEMMHALEFAGIVTKEEVERYGGREGIAEKYGKWAEAKYRKKDSVFQRIYDALEAVFSSQRKFFEEVGERKAAKPESAKGTSLSPIGDKTAQTRAEKTEPTPSEEELAKVKAAGIKVEKTKKGWIVTGLPSDLSQEMRDGIEFEGGRKTGNGYFFKENPTSRLVPTAEAIADENRKSDEAAKAGLVSTPIGILSQEDADWYRGERQQRLELAKQMLNDANNAVNELLSQFVPSANRGLFKISLMKAAETGDPNTILRFDEMVDYSINHPELGLPQDESGLFDRLLQSVIQEKDLAKQIDDELATELASDKGDDSFNFGTQQTAIEGLEEDVARQERKDVSEAKQAKSKKQFESDNSKGKQKTFLTDIYGDPTQGTLFDPDGVADEDQPQNDSPRGGGAVMAVMTSDGTIYSDPKAATHYDVVEKFDLDSSDIIDGGFIIDGKYKMAMSDGGYAATEGEPEQVATVRRYADEYNTKQGKTAQTSADQVNVDSGAKSESLSVDEFADIFANPEKAKKPKAKKPSLSDDDVADRLFDIQDGDSLDLPLWRAGNVSNAQGAFYSPRSERSLRYGKKAERTRVRLKYVLVGETKEDVAKTLKVQSEFYDAQDNAPADQDPDVLSDIVLKEAAQKLGYDGIVFRMDGMGSPEVYAFPAAKPKKTGEKKTPSEGVQEGLDEAKAGADLIMKGLKDLGSSFFSGPPINRDIAVGMGMMANGLIKAGKYKFIEFIDEAVKLLGAPAVRYLGPYLEAGWNKKSETDDRLDKATSVADYLNEESTDYGTVENPNRVELGKHFASRFAEGASYVRITDARKEAAELLGGTPKDGTSAIKDIDEAVEIGVVRHARDIAQSGLSDSEIYDQLVDLYTRQPNLGTRTSTSMAEQAYSTPAPLAYVVNKRAGVTTDDTVYDSSAGNGMLLIVGGTRYANELNPDRAESLRGQGIETTSEDATEFEIGKPIDALVINPPFGQVKNDAGKPVQWNIDGVRTDKIDHAITLQSLKDIPEDGKVAIIIGAKGFEKREPKADSQRGVAYLGEKKFYDTLYDNYNVVDHFTVHGDLYSRQGASFPVDVIIVQGKGKSQRPKPYNITGGGIPSVIKTWEELKDAKLRSITGASSASTRGNNADDSDSVGSGNAIATSGDAKKPSSKSSSGRVGGKDRGVTRPEGLGQPSGQPGVSNTTDGKKPTSGKSDGNQSGRTNTRQRNADRPSGPDSGDRLKPDETAETSYQVSYRPGSNNASVDTLIPRNHQSAVTKSLESVADIYGDIDEFVANELGYSMDELADAFSAEQVDALALAIARHKDGGAFIIGDQTGVGKGRAAAAMMVYANRQGLIPVFVTEKPTLYADMVRDLIDIGRSTEDSPFNVLMTNSLSGKDVVPLPDGRSLKQSPTAAQKNLASAVESVLDGGVLSVEGKGKNAETVEYNAIFTTYSQLQPVKQMAPERFQKLKSISDRSFYILDESHNAGGGADSDPNANQERRSNGQEAAVSRAELVRDLIGTAAGVYFSSATYAKRSQTMGLYARTGMTAATNNDAAKLSEAIATGGVPLQQVVSEQLVESGMYLRRERSFDGVEFVPKTVGVDLSNLDNVSAIFNAINTLDKYAQDAIKELQDEITSAGGAIRDTEATGQAGIESTSFSSILHNLVDQMLLAVKADAVADETIASIKAGESPVIYVDSTLEAALKRQVDDMNVKAGDEIDFSYRDLVRRYLERSREYTVRRDLEDADSVERVRLTDDQLGPAGVAAYERALDMIAEFEGNMPASPIDWIRKRVNDAGYSIGEITGRQVVLEYGNDGKVRLGKRPDDEAGAGGRTATVAKFNAGELDAVLINPSGSTGISMHASEKFKNQKPRHMIIGQPSRNIDTFMQALGRVHRTGQVVLPRFTLMMTDAPAEIRPASVLVKKLASLNANVTASAKGSVSFDVPDVINIIGDQIVAEYLADNPALDLAIGEIVSLRSDGTPRRNPGIAKRASGRMALRPVAEQQLFWDSVVASYNELVDELNRIGKNPLVAATLDLQAKTLESTTIFEGDATSANAFLQPASIELVRANKPGSPMTSAEVTEAITTFYGKPVTRSVAIEWLRATQKEVQEAYAEYSAAQTKDLSGEELATKQESLEREGNRRLTNLMNRLQDFAPGMAVSVYDKNGDGSVQDVVPGFVTKVKRSKGGNPLASSKWSIEVAIASPDRVAKSPLSRTGEQQPEGMEGYREFLTNNELINDKLLKEFEETDSSPTEQRYIGVGNILAAYSQLGKSGGQITFFTDANGNVRRGVLMPRSFNVDQWADARPVVLDTVQDVRQFLASGSYLNTPDKALNLMMIRGDLVLRAPKAKSRGGKYTLNSAILSAAAPLEFVSIGSRMEMVVQDKSQQEAVLKAVMSVASLQADSDKNLARQIKAASESLRNQSGDTDVRPIGDVIGMPGVSREQAMVMATPSRGSGGVAQMANPTRQSRSNGAGADGIAAADIQKTAERLFNVAIRQGGFSQRAAGIYKWITRRNSPPSPEMIRTAEDHYANLAVIAHEIAHHIDETTKAVNSMPKAVKNEVAALDYEPQKARAFEGWAEFLRRYMTEPPIDVNGSMIPNPGIDAPATLAWFESTFLQAHPDVAKSVAEFRQYAQQWANQSVFARVGSMISDRKPQDLRFAERWKQKGKRWLNRLKSNFLDKFHTLKWIQEESRDKGYKGIGIYDLTMAYFMSATSHATIALEEGVRTLTEGKPIGKVKLWELSRHLENDGEYNEAVRYALARHTLFMDQVKPGYNTGVDVEDAQALVDEAKALGKADRYEEFSKELAQFNDDLIMMLVDAGALSRSEANKILDYYRDKNGVPHYFPLHRVMDLEGSEFAGTSSGFVNLGPAVKGRSRKGSGRQIIDPIDATVTRAIKFYSRAIQARQAHTLAKTLDPKLGGVGGMGGLMDRIPAKRIVNQGTIEEILNTLVDSGTIEADQARAMRIAARILDPANGGMASEKDLDWFANKHQIVDWQNNWVDMETAAESEPDALAVISLWRPDYTPNAAKRTVMIYDQAGNKLMYELDDDLYQTATGMQEVQFNVFMNLLRESQRYFKSGAVALSTGFGSANIIRDYGEFQGKANYVKGLRTLTKPWQMLGTYIAEKVRQSIVGKIVGKKLGLAPKPANALIRLYEELGGKVYSIIGSETNSRSIYRRKKLGKSTMSKLGLSIMRPMDTAENLLQSMQDIIAISDAPPRLADAEAALAEHGFVASGDKWLDTRTGTIVDHLPESARIAASVAIAEATINFKRIGAAGQYVEAFLPFSNAITQATYRQYQQIKNLKNLGQDTPEGSRAKRLLVYLAALASTAVVYWLWRHDDDDYRNQEGWLRDGYWTWGANGKTYVRIPKPRDFAIVSNVVENILDGQTHEDARKNSDVIMRDVGGRLPTGGGLTRGAVETYIANYDYFRGRELENESMKDIPKQYRTSSYTSRMSDYLGKHLGKVLNTSPIQFQHLLNSASGGMYGRLTDTYDAAQDGRLGPEHVPFARGLMLDRMQTRPIGEFYAKKQELDGIAATQKIEQENVSPEVADQLAHYGWISEVMTALRQGESKIGKKRTFENEKYITGLARAALGYKEQKSNPNPMTAKDLPNDVRQIIDEYRQLAVAGAAERLSPRSVFKSDEAYEKQKAQIERAEAKFRMLNMPIDEAKQTLIDYWKKTHGKNPDSSKFRKLDSLFSESSK